MWFAGLPTAVCGWMLEAVKQAGDNPPAFLGAGYNLARCKMNGGFVRGRRSHFVWRDARSALAPSDEGAGFLRSKKTGGENDTKCILYLFSPSVFAFGESTSSPLSVTACAVPPLPAVESLTLVRGRQGTATRRPIIHHSFITKLLHYLYFCVIITWYVIKKGICPAIF